jgi:hypothetical protein
MRLQWRSYEEFTERLRPRFLDQRHFSAAMMDPPHALLSNLAERLQLLKELVPRLEHILVSLKDAPPADVSLSPSITLAVEAGEFVLLCRPRLLGQRASHRFIAARAVIDQYETRQSQKRLMELQLFIDGCIGLIKAVAELDEDDAEFLLQDLTVPEPLKVDFELARDLFNLDQDDIALVATARGLEGVLREIAKHQRVEVKGRGKVQLAHELDLAELIDVMHRLRWKASDKPLIGSDVRNLLHYARAVRNIGAHAETDRSVSRTAREMARIMAMTASELWTKGTRPRARLVTRTVDRG